MNTPSYWYYRCKTEEGQEIEGVASGTMIEVAVVLQRKRKLDLKKLSEISYADYQHMQRLSIKFMNAMKKREQLQIAKYRRMHHKKKRLYDWLKNFIY